MKLIAQDISVDRGDRRIVSGVSFEVDSGSAIIITGENGSGKSTLLRAIAGLLPLSGGSVSMSGKGAEAFPLSELAHYLGHKNAMKEALTVGENLTFWQEYCGDPWMSPQEALDQVDLSHTIDLPFGYLSAGQKRRSAMAKLLVSEKPLWVLDEPTAALDAMSSGRFSEICQDYCADGGMIVAATHLPLGIKNSNELHLKVASQNYTDIFADEHDGTDG